MRDAKSRDNAQDSSSKIIQNAVESLGVITMKGWKIAVAAVLVGVVTYFGLELLLPHHKVEVKMEGLVPADSVFGDSLKAPDQVAAAEATTPGAADVNGPAAGTSSDAAASSDDAMAPAGDDAAADTSAEPSADAAAASDSEAAPEPETAPAAAEPEPAAPPVEKPKPAAKPAPKPAAKPAPKKDAAPVKPTTWWVSGKSDGLQLVYAGSASFERAIVLLSGSPFAGAASANQNIHVSDSSGNAVAGQWKLSPNNSKMLIFPVPAKGTFKVSVDAGLKGANNQTVGKPLKGAVLVQ